jgi:type IV secretion system protein VirB4
MLKNAKKVIQASNDIKKRKKKIVDRSNFIPYACFYNSNTVLTKNGELLQTIKYSPFSADQSADVTLDLRAMLRKALVSFGDISDISFYIHTIRDSREIEWSILKEKETLDYEIHKQWREINKFNGVFVNEVFLTIVSRGKDYPLAKPSTILSFFNSSKLQKNFFSFVESSIDRLNKISEHLMKETKEVGPSKLGFYKSEEDIYKSEHLELFDRLINLIKVDCSIPLSDISQFLNISNYKIGFSDIFVSNLYDTDKFVAVFSLKDYQDMSLNLVDKLLSLPIKMTVSQYFDNTKYPLARQYFLEAASLLQMSDDLDFYKNSGMFDITQNDNKDPKHFGETQISISIHAYSKLELTKNLQKFVDCVAEIGFCAIREDVFNEDVFYSILPANYSFLVRKKYSHLSKFGAFAIRATYPTGNEYPEKWEQAITVFTTIRQTPYFFNYHPNESSGGHVIITGPKGSGASVLSNFLISESLKLKPKIINLSIDNSSDLFIGSISGIAKTFKRDLANSKDAIKMNPFSLFHSKKEFVHKSLSDNFMFIKHYLHMMLELGMEKLSVSEAKDLEQALFTFQKDYNAVTNIKDFAKLLKLDSNKERIDRFLYEGEYFGLFSLDDDDFDAFDFVISINIEEILADETITDIMLEYIFYRINIELDGTRVIIKLDDVIELFNTSHFQAVIFEKWLTKLKKYNAVCIINLDTSNTDELSKHVSSDLFGIADSHFFLPESIFHQTYLSNDDKLIKREDDLRDFYKKECKMSSETLRTFISISDKVHKNILLRHNGLDAVLEFDLVKAPFVLTLLNSSFEVREIFTRIKENNPESSFAQVFQIFCKEFNFEN